MTKKGVSYEEYFGKEKSEEFKLRLSEENKEWLREQGQKIALFRTGKTYEELYGEKRAKEIKEKLSKSNKRTYEEIYGIEEAKKQREKRSKALTGRSFSKEHRRNISKAQIGRHLSEEHKRNILKAVLEFPTSYEQKIIDLCEEYDLPFEYVGDGQFFINHKNPDFIAINGKKLVIETYCNYWHPDDYEETRYDLFFECGFKTLFLNDKDLNCKNWEENCLEKILSFL